MTNLLQSSATRSAAAAGFDETSLLRQVRWRLDRVGHHRLLVLLDLTASLVVAATFAQVEAPELLFHIVFVILTAEAYIFGRRICLQRIAALSVALIVYVSLPSFGVAAAPLELSEWPLMFTIAVLVAWMADREQSVARRYAQLYRDTRDRLVRAQEEERARLARDLHDGTAQTLTALRLTLDAVAGAHLPEVAARDLDRARELAGEAIDDTRQIADAVRPPRLFERGLVGALRAMASTPGGRVAVSVGPGADVHFDSPDVELEIYRIAQEAVRNALQHASASEIAVALVRVRSGYRLEVTDDGVGFEWSAVKEHRLGIVGMRERAAAIGASLEIASTPSAGTRVTLFIPAGIAAGTERAA